jgi:hypothetical protein
MPKMIACLICARTVSGLMRAAIDCADDAPDTNRSVLRQFDFSNLGHRLARTHFMRRPYDSPYASVRVFRIGSSETSIPLVKLVGMKRSPFSTFLVASALVIAISPSSRLVGCPAKFWSHRSWAHPTQRAAPAGGISPAPSRAPPGDCRRARWGAAWPLRRRSHRPGPIRARCDSGRTWIPLAH